MTIWVIIGGGLGIWFIINITLILFNNQKETQLKREKVILESKQIEFEQRELFKKYKEEVRVSLDALIKEKAQGFPWLSTAIADYYENYDKIFADYLTTKKHPAYVQAEKIKEIAKEKKLFKKEFLTTKYIIDYYETLFPWLKEYVGFNSEDLIKSIYLENISEENDPVSFYITKAEFENLSVTERNQRALDRYWNRDKDPWQIGRDYERYIGYLYEMNGFKVQYHGIEKLKDDLGRDLICTRGNDIEIVQCKYWSNQKGIPIRENHITQLYGTTIKYYLDHKRSNNNKIQMDMFPNFLQQSNIFPVLITTTDLSDTAKEFAKVLGIIVNYISMDRNYPCIKCNINFQTNERIYHLPFDQQYDNTVIDTNKGECWASSIKEAENLGFRRAWRWKPKLE